MASLVAEGCAVMCEVLGHYILSQYTDGIRNDKRNKKRRQRRWWVRAWIENRSLSGATHFIDNELCYTFPEDFKNLLRMSEENFHFLLERVSPLIQKKDTNMREAIPAKGKLMITLRYLAADNSFKSLEFFFKIPKSTISKFLVEVLDAIITSLGEFIKVSTYKYILRKFNQIL